MVRIQYTYILQPQLKKNKWAVGSKLCLAVLSHLLEVASCVQLYMSQLLAVASCV